MAEAQLVWLRERVRAFPEVGRWDDEPVSWETQWVRAEDGYELRRIEYEAPDGDVIPALLLRPAADGPFAAIIVFHQHHAQWHLGKSEVAGLAGEPLQAFGPALARAGMVVLAPDSVCFEDRRRQTSGTEPHEHDKAQHDNEMAYRLLAGDTLMRKVLDDAALALSILHQLPETDPDRLGLLGHSYGGNTVLFQAAVDERVAFACASGAAGSYKAKIANEVGIERAEIIPGVLQQFDIDDLVRPIAPRPLLLVAGTDDPYALDVATSP